LRDLIRLRFLKSDWPEDFGLFNNALNTASLQQWATLPVEKKEPYLKQLLLDQKTQPTEDIKVGNLIEDFYLIKNGGDLDKSLIPQERLAVYSQILPVKKAGEKNSNPRSSQLTDFLSIFSTLIQSLPSDDFVIDLHSLEIRRVH
jgi:hypothetical protein